MPIQIADAYSDSIFAQRQTGLLFNLPAPGPQIEQLPEGVSLCMIVKNEERFLAECLESVKDCVDEICIVDTGSTDRTVEIARSYGAKIEFREWRNDFAWARNESLAMATKRWTLVLDGDEELTRESVPLLRALRTTPAGLAAIYINIINVVNDTMGVGTMSHRLLRLLPTNPRMRFTNVIHESLTLLGDDPMMCVLSPLAIFHKGYTEEMLSAREKDARNKPLLTRAYEENGSDPFALFNFGNSAISSGDYDLGIEVLQRMLAMPGTPKMYYPLAYIMLGQAFLLGKHDYEKALEMLETGIKRFPRDAGLVFQRGQTLAKMKRFDEAREAYEETLTLRDGMASAVMTDEEIFEWKVFCALSSMYERQGDLEKALEWIQRAVANKSNSAPLQRILGQMNENLGRYYDAELAFRRVAELDTMTGAVHLMNFLLRRNRFGQAIAMIEATGDDERNAGLLVQLNVAAARGIIAQKSGDPLPYIQAALRRSPGCGSALAMYDDILRAREDVDGLAELHAREMDAPVVQPDDYVRRVYRLLALQRPADAWDVAERGLEIAPENAELRFNAALALARSGHDRQAAEHFARIEEHDTAVFADAQQMRAALLARLGDVAAAAVAIRAWVAAKDDDANAVVTSARWLVQVGGHTHARALLTDFAERDRRIATELASMLLNEGDLAGAGAVAERALR